MYIEYDNLKIKKQLLKYARSNRKTAKRMSSIKAANNFCDLEMPSNGRAHFLKGNFEGFFALDLEKIGNGKRIICKPLDFELCENVSGDFKKETIKGLRIMKIEDYH